MVLTIMVVKMVIVIINTITTSISIIVTSISISSSNTVIANDASGSINVANYYYCGCGDSVGANDAVGGDCVMNW